MFSRGLENLLRQDRELIILGQETDVEQAVRQITELQPEVAIIYSDDSLNSFRLLIIEVLKSNPETKVIGLNLQNNTFYVYQAIQGETTSLEDLLRVIKDRPYWLDKQVFDPAKIGDRWAQDGIQPEQSPPPQL